MQFVIGRTRPESAFRLAVWKWPPVHASANSTMNCTSSDSRFAQYLLQYAFTSASSALTEPIIFWAKPSNSLLFSALASLDQYEIESFFSDSKSLIIASIKLASLAFVIKYRWRTNDPPSRASTAGETWYRKWPIFSHIGLVGPCLLDVFFDQQAIAAEIIVITENSKFF